MQNPRVFAFLAALAVVAGLAFWLFGTRNEELPAPAIQPVEATPEPAAPAPEVATGNGTEPTTAVEPARIAVAAPAAVASGPALIGKVVDEDGRPIAGATVGTGITNLFSPRALASGDFDFEDAGRTAERLRDRMANSAQAITATDGSFRLAVDGDGVQVQIEARARAFQALTRFVSRPTNADVDVGALTLARGAVISGKVVDQENRAIAGASVLRLPRGQMPGGPMQGTPGPRGSFPGMNFASGEVADLMRGMLGDVLTDAEGRFELPNAAPGEFALRVRHQEHPVATRDGLSVAVGQSLSDLLLVLDRGAEIRGVVTGIPNGTAGLRVLAAPAPARSAPPAAGGNDPLAGMGAQFQELMSDFALAAERSAEVGADGAFVLRGLTNGARYRIWATQSGRGFFDNNACSQRVEVAAGATAVELRFDPGVVVVAKVVDDRTGAPVEAMVVRHQFEGSGLADMASMAQGMMGRAARVRNVPGGAVTIPSLRPKPEQKLRLTIEAIGYRKFEQREIALPAAGEVDLGTLRLIPSPVVRVTVVDKSGTPVPAATVSLRSADPGAGGDGGRRGGDLAARLEAAVSGAGRGGAGNPFAAMAGGGIATQKTDADGRAQLNVPSNGSFQVVVDKQAFAPYRSQPIGPVADAGIDHRATLLVGGSATVTAFDSDGKPLANARIEHETPSGDSDRRDGGAEGQAVFEHLEPGSHKFRLASSGGGARFTLPAERRAPAADEAQWVTAEVADGVRVEVELQKSATARLTGIVRENGAPLQGARVQFVAGSGDEPAASGGDPVADLMRQFGGGGGGRGPRTDAEGRYELKDLQPGQHRVRFTVDGRSMPTIARVFLRLGDNVLDVDLDAAKVRGVVLAPDGKPVAGATVRVSAAADTAPSLEGMMQNLPFGNRRGGGGGGSAPKTDAQGRFELAGVQSGVPLVVRAQAKGYAGGESAPVTVDAGQTSADLEVRMLSAGTVKVTATSSQPFAAVMATYEGQDQKGVAPVFGMLQNGAAVLEGLRPGSWRIALRTGFGGFGGQPGNRGGGGGDPSQVVQVVAGQTIDVAL